MSTKKTAFDAPRRSIFMIPPEKIIVRPEKNTSRLFAPSDDARQALLESIRQEKRVIQPIIVIKDFDTGDPEVVVGYQRVWAATEYNKSVPEDQRILIPAIYEQNLSDEAREELNITENIAKVSLSEIERAYLMDRYRKMGRSMEWIAEKFGVKASSVTQQLKVMALPKEYHERVHRGEIGMNVAIFAAEIDPKKRDEVIAEATQEARAANPDAKVVKPSLSAVQAVARKREALPSDKKVSRKMSEVNKFFKTQLEELLKGSKASALSKDLLLYFAGDISDQAMQNRLIKYTDGDNYSGTQPQKKGGK